MAAAAAAGAASSSSRRRRRKGLPRIADWGGLMMGVPIILP